MSRGLGRLGRPSIREGEHSIGVEPVERADELPAERLEAVQPAAFRAAEVEAEGVPMRVRVAGVVAEEVEMRLPLGPAVFGPDLLRKRPMEGVAPGDPEQLDRGVVDEVRELLQLVVEQAVAGVKLKQPLDPRHGGQVNCLFYDGHVKSVNASQFDPKVTKYGQNGCLWDNVPG